MDSVCFAWHIRRQPWAGLTTTAFLMPVSSTASWFDSCRLLVDLLQLPHEDSHITFPASRRTVIPTTSNYRANNHVSALRRFLPGCFHPTHAHVTFDPGRVYLPDGPSTGAVSVSGCCRWLRGTDRVWPGWSWQEYGVSDGRYFIRRCNRLSFLFGSTHAVSLRRSASNGSRRARYVGS